MIRSVKDDRSDSAAAYRQGLGLAAVAVLRGPQAMRIIAVAADAEANAAALDGAAALWWCRSAADAARIAAAATRSLRREANALACQADESAKLSRSIAAVLAAADKLGLALQSDADIAGEAAQVAARIEAELRKQQQSGGLKAVNKAYRAYRLDSRRRGERVLRYGEWMQKYRENLVRQVALTLRRI